MDLAALLESPSESLDVELKGWLDLQQDKEHRGQLAKAIIALANHGGGHILVGFAKNGLPDTNRPTILAGYLQDDINGLVKKYCEPPFHVEVRFVRRNHDGLEYPIVTVPGGHGLPIRSCSETPLRSIVNNTYYIRRLGPSSESPQDGREWDQLIGRAIRNRKDEIIDEIRDLLGGRAPSIPQAPAVLDTQKSWLDEGIRRWKSSLVAHGIAQGEFQWMPLGHWTFSYSLLGDFATPNAVAFKDALRSAYRQLTGWPVFIWLTTGEWQPRLVSSDVIECHISQPTRFSDGAHADFWVARTDGQLFLRRGYIEDARVVPVEPGATFDFWLPILRNAEGLLHAQRLAEVLGAGRVRVFVRYTGLKKRRLSVLPGPDRAPVFDFIEKGSSMDTLDLSIEVEASRIQAALPEILRSLLRDLYAAFDFTEPPSLEDIDREVKKVLRV
jgi:hypothetical protein